MSQSHDDLAGPDRDAPHGDAPDVPSTGHPAIDEALERLSRVDELDISLHPEEFDAVHGVLRESLAHAGRDEVAPESA